MRKIPKPANWFVVMLPRSNTAGPTPVGDPCNPREPRSKRSLFREDERTDPNPETQGRPFAPLPLNLPNHPVRSQETALARQVLLWSR